MLFLRKLGRSLFLGLLFAAAPDVTFAQEETPDRPPIQAVTKSIQPRMEDHVCFQAE